MTIQGPDRYPPGMATTTAADDDYTHEVYDTGSFGILTRCGQTGTSPVRLSTNPTKPSGVDCPVCLEASR